MAVKLNPTAVLNVVAERLRAHLNGLIVDFEALGDIESIDWLPQHSHMLSMRKGRLAEISDLVDELGLTDLREAVDEAQVRFA